MNLPTVKVRMQGHNDPVLINQEDFDPEIHQPEDEVSKRLADEHEAKKRREKRKGGHGEQTETQPGAPSPVPPSPQGAPDPSIKNTPSTPPTPPVGQGAPPAKKEGGTQ